MSSIVSATSSLRRKAPAKPMTLRAGAKRHHQQGVVALAEQRIRQSLDRLPKLCWEQGSLAVWRHALGPPNAAHGSLDLGVLRRQGVPGLLVVVADTCQPPIQRRDPIGVALFSERHSGSLRRNQRGIAQ